MLLTGLNQQKMPNSKQTNPRPEEKSLFQSEAESVYESKSLPNKAVDWYKRHGTFKIIGVISSLVAIVGVALSGYNGIISRIDNRFSDVQSSFSEKLSDISELTNNNSVTLGRVDERLVYLKEDVSELKVKTSQIKDDVSDLQTDVEILKTEVKRIEAS